MREKNINTLFLIFAAAITVMLAAFIIINLKGYLGYEKLSNATIPQPAAEKIDYYNQAVSLISQSIELDRLNSDYAAFKADLLAGLSGDDLYLAGDIRKKEIEELYLKAISLNPVNFEYHLKLGWFYAQINENKAAQEMQKAIELYPSYYRNYMYFSKYYLKNKKEKEAFSSLLLAIYRANGRTWRKIMEEMTDDLKKSTAFSYDEVNRQLSFFVAAPGEGLDFKKYGLPHINIPLSLKVYVSVQTNPEIFLYKNNMLFGHFKKIASKGEMNIYEFNIAPNADIYLDELAIKTSPVQAIEKVEFMKILR